MFSNSPISNKSESNGELSACTYFLPTFLPLEITICIYVWVYICKIINVELYTRYLYLLHIQTLNQWKWVTVPKKIRNTHLHWTCTYVYIVRTLTGFDCLENHSSVNLKGSTTIKSRSGSGSVFAKFEGNRLLRKEVSWGNL